jgi:hypothetical protein
MTQHYTRNTVEASAWCRVCGRDTMHRIDGVKLGPCLACIKRLELQKELPGIERPKEPEQMTLMERYGQVDIG